MATKQIIRLTAFEKKQVRKVKAYVDAHLQAEMPVMDGHEVFLKLQRQGCTTAIIVMSQYNQARFIRGMAAAGVPGFLDNAQGVLLFAPEYGFYEP